ncbi:MAG: OmpA family protein [Desulfuromonadaceae bacterium]|nr:OmpA family protein [Desulfuromonadaceae bacterium]
MKVTKCFIALLILTGLLIPAAALAELKTGVVTVSPMLGGVLMEGDQPVDNDGFAYSLGLGYNLSQQFGLEAVLGGANLDSDNSSSSDVDLFTYRLDALYRFMPDNKLVPYLAAGVGGYDLDSDHEWMANYGGGLLYFFAENIALRADVRHLLAFNESNLENNLTYTAGFLFQFAGEAAPAPKAPLDSDGDGVTDDLDQCPNTPAGAPVDSKGCPLDSDGDGVFDYLDQCPDTPAGAPVDSKGCPLDSDGDGVFVYLDQCPDTPAGMAVDAAGCSLELTLRINFDSDSAVIKPSFKGELDKAAAFVRANANAPFILLAGHTDSQGSAAYNQKLSERRAEAVRQALIDQYGLDGNKLKSRGLGEIQPKADNQTADGRYQNRRVELVCCAVLPE